MRTGITVFAALVAASLAATPLVMGASNALAVSQDESAVPAPVTVVPVEVAPVSAASQAETCVRKVRVVYSGYGTAGACR
ncbi:hypothetical protein [Methylobacterium sp. sgz302541]|uniref:hypothetical protein n=1 Tax=unclassified Methylobacterium TaxID=2615210 RepID=UPI003D334A19